MLPLHDAVDVGQLLNAGLAAAVDEESQRTLVESESPTYRAGNQGVLLPGSAGTAQVGGACHRKAAARMLGATPPRTADEAEDWLRKQLMFEAGRASEDSFVAAITRTWSGAIRREEECPVEWEVDGRRGTGRPDVVLCDDSGTPQQLVELKLVSSLSTAVDAMFWPSGSPKLEHLCQAGRYMQRLGVPGTLLYIQRAVLATPHWSFVLSAIPEQGQPTTEIVDYGKDGKPSKLQPGFTEFHLRWHEGRLYWRRIGIAGDEWFPSVVTEEALDDFWRLTQAVVDGADNGPRQSALKADGAKKHGWSPCDAKYCEWSAVCAEHNDNPAGWVAAVREHRPEKK